MTKTKNQKGFIQPDAKQQAGFIPMLILILLILAGIILLVYLRVAHSK